MPMCIMAHRSHGSAPGRATAISTSTCWRGLGSICVSQAAAPPPHAHDACSIALRAREIQRVTLLHIDSAAAD